MAGAPRPSFSQIQARARDSASAAIGRGLPEAARAAIAEADAFLAEAARILDLETQLAGLACGKGCSWCCHQMVGVTAAEIALLAEAVAALAPARRKVVRARIVEQAARSAGMDPKAWWEARLACPLLDGDGACAVHAARPLPCRAMNSADAAICESGFKGTGNRIPALAAQHGIYGNAQAGLAQALAARGITAGPYALATALNSAIT